MVERKTVEIEARVRDFASRQFRTIGASIVAFAKTGFDALRRMGRAVFDVRTLLTGFVGFVVARRAFAGLTDIAEGIDEIAKTSDRLGATTKSLQELEFVAKLGGSSLEQLSPVLAILARNLDNARRGTAQQAAAFRELGIDVNNLPLGPGGKVDLLELLAQAADGFTNLAPGMDRTRVLLDSFGRSGAQLGPLLAQGSAALREQAAEFARLGGILDDEQLQRAARFDDALARLQVSFTGLARAAFVELAPRLSAFFERLARAIGDNREVIVSALQAIGRSVLRFIDLLTDAGIKAIEFFEALPFVDLIDRERLQGELDKSVRGLDLAVLRDAARDVAARTGKTFDEALAEEFEGIRVLSSRGLQLALSGVDPAPIQRLAELGIEGVRAGIQGLGDASVETLQGEIARIREVLAVGFAGTVRQAKADLVTELDELSRRAEALGAAPAPTPAPLPDEDEGQRRPGGELAELQRAQRRAAFAADLLGQARATREVREQLAVLAAETERLQLAKVLQEGTASAGELAIALGLVDERLARALQSIDLGERLRGIGVAREVLELQRPTREVTDQLAVLATEAERIRLGERFQEGTLSAGELSTLLDQLNANLDRTLQLQGLAAQRQDIDFARQVLELAPATLEVERSLERLGAESRALDFQQAFLEGRISAEQLAQGLDLVAQNLERIERLRDIANQREQLGFAREMLEAELPTRAVRLELEQIAAETRRLNLQEAFEQGRISAEQLAAGLERINEQLAAQGERIRGNFSRGFVEGAREALESFTDLSRVGADLARDLLDSGLGQLSDAFGLLILDSERGTEAIREWGRNMLQVLAQVITRLLFIKALGVFFPSLNIGQGLAEGGVVRGNLLDRRPARSGGGTPAFASGGTHPGRLVQRLPLSLDTVRQVAAFAEGGVQRGRLAHRAALPAAGRILAFAKGGVAPGNIVQHLPLRAYQEGGIARSPQIAIFGEGKQAEAFVPLPDGRSIPVSLRGAHPSVVQLVFEIRAMDGRDVQRMLVEQRGTIVGLYQQALASATPPRQSVQKAVG